MDAGASSEPQFVNKTSEAPARLGARAHGQSVRGLRGPPRRLKRHAGESQHRPGKGRVRHFGKRSFRGAPIARDPGGRLSLRKRRHLARVGRASAWPLGRRRARAAIRKTPAKWSSESPVFRLKSPSEMPRASGRSRWQKPGSPFGLAVSADALFRSAFSGDDLSRPGDGLGRLRSSSKLFAFASLATRSKRP